MCLCAKFTGFSAKSYRKEAPHMRKLHEYFVLYKEVVTYMWLCSLHPLLSSFYILFDSVPWKIYSSFFSLQDFCYFCKCNTQNCLVKVTSLSWIVLKADLNSCFICLQNLARTTRSVSWNTPAYTDSVDLSTVKLTHVISLPPWPNCHLPSQQRRLKCTARQEKVAGCNILWVLVFLLCGQPITIVT